ncbi:MAG: flavin reductase family protein [Anaerolineales bacterium]|nr:flavin reductase family protein [Anaerolineales bacterium]
MTSIFPQDLQPRDVYRLLISIVVPRPIAWVSSLGADGSLNLAPFSFFNAVAGNPPTVMFSVGQRQGVPKDTLRNVRETGEFVLNVVDEALAEKMNLTSGEYAYEVNEFERAGLTPLASMLVKPPRVAEAAVTMECRATQIVPVQDTTYTMVLGQVQVFHVREGLLRPNGAVDATLLKPVARLSGDEYATLGTVFEMKRPSP